MTKIVPITNTIISRPILSSLTLPYPENDPVIVICSPSPPRLLPVRRADGLRENRGDIV